MIRDRLEELRQATKLCNASSSESLCIINHEDVEYVRESDTPAQVEELDAEYVVLPHNPAMEALLNVYSAILEEFRLIRNNVGTMRNMTGAKNAKSFNEKDFHQTRQRTIQIGNNIMNKFQTLETNLPPDNEFSTLARMKRILYYGLFQTYVDVWAETEKFLQEYETNIKKTLRAQSKILEIDLNEEEIEALISHKQTSLYACNILEDTENARKTLQALTERLGDLKKLEKSLEEVHTLFIRLQRLVVEQGAVMQSIEKHFQDAENYVEKAAEDIAKASQYKKKSFKNKIILFMISIIILLTVLLIVIFI